MLARHSRLRSHWPIQAHVGDHGDDTAAQLRVVLIVDDNEDNLTIYSAYLKQRGYGVAVARNGREGVERAMSDPPHLILMDLSMPVLDGFAALMLLRADASTENIPVIALTAHALREERERGMEFGFDGYLSKPIHPLDVIREVERFIGTAAGGGGE